MNKSDEKLVKLKEMMLSGNPITIEMMCTQLDIKRSRAYDYINCLLDEGFVFNKTIDNRRTVFTLASSPKESPLYYPINKKDILKYHILSSLSNSPMTTEELFSCLSLRGDISVSKSSFFSLINEMISDKLLISTSKQFDGKNNRKYTKRVLCSSGLNNSLVIKVDVDGQTRINSFVAKAQPQSTALHSLYRKMALLTGDNTELQYDESIFLQYGRGYHINENLQDYYTLLMNNNFISNAISFEYRGKPMQFETGMVVYSQDKDMLYLLGRKIGTHNISILKFPEISNISGTNLINKEYNQKKYNEYLNDMFSISVDNPVKVKLSFKKTPDNAVKLQKLCQLRVNGNIEFLENEIIYTDQISGISDFANYLRGYGYDFEVIYPQALKDAIKTTLTRSLSRYE